MTNYSRVVASIVNFEEAYFSETVENDKPENCINHLKIDAAAYSTIKQLLDGILEINQASLPNGATTWAHIDDLDSHVMAWDTIVSVLPT